MALSFQESQNAIDSQKATRPQLDVVNTPSNVSIWKLQKDVWASAASFISTLFDIRNQEAKEIGASLELATIPWVRQKVLEYQEGYNLVVKDFKAQYEVIDEDARVIKRCSIREKSNRVVTVMVSGANVYTPFSRDYLRDTLRPALAKVLFAGVETKFVSFVPDRLYVKAYIIASGINATSVLPTAIAALRNYCVIFSDIRYDGSVYLNDIIDTLQAIQGVQDVIIKEIYIRGLESDPSEATTLFRIGSPDPVNNGHASTYSGVLVEEDLAGSSFDDTVLMFGSMEDLKMYDPSIFTPPS